MPDELFRAIIGALISAGVSFAALRADALSRGGAALGILVGTVSVAAGWIWGVLLLAFFIPSTIVSRIGARRKAAIVNSIVAKSGNRDGRQVLANGGLFTAAAAAYLVSGSPVWLAVGAGALAASTADTWATEVGTLFGEPRSIVSGQRVPAGTSGGVTVAGLFASLGGALFIAGVCSLMAWPIPIQSVIAGGVAGAIGDSVAGATIQERRWCDACHSSTERRLHGCGTATRHTGGIAGLDNDVVNVLCSGIGALVTLLMA